MSFIRNSIVNRPLREVGSSGSYSVRKVNNKVKGLPKSIIDLEQPYHWFPFVFKGFLIKNNNWKKERDNSQEKRKCLKIFLFILCALCMFLSINEGKAHPPFQACERKAQSRASDFKGVANPYSKMPLNIPSPGLGERNSLPIKDAFQSNPISLKGGMGERGSSLYVLVSFSLHPKVLESLLKESKRYGATLVVRGLKDNSWAKTLRDPLLRQGSLMIDPMLFKRFKVTHVPTILVVGKNERRTDPYLKSFEKNGLKGLFRSKEGTLEEEVFDKVSGNISLKYALSLFLKEGDVFKREKLQGLEKELNAKRMPPFFERAFPSPKGMPLDEFFPAFFKKSSKENAQRKSQDKHQGKHQTRSGKINPKMGHRKPLKLT